jgi:hypothetical protein
VLPAPFDLEALPRHVDQHLGPAIRLVGPTFGENQPMSLGEEAVLGVVVADGSFEKGVGGWGLGLNGPCGEGNSYR